LAFEQIKFSTLYVNIEGMGPQIRSKSADFNSFVIVGVNLGLYNGLSSFIVKDLPRISFSLSKESEPIHDNLYYKDIRNFHKFEIKYLKVCLLTS